MPLVSICVATYQRPDGLRALLESIEGQVLSNDIDVEVIIVDNDPPSAEDVVTSHGDTSRFPVRYLSQSEPNISLTRNVGVAAANGDLVWFVDDDEVAEPSCLDLLVSAIDDFDADVVFGPVLSAFDNPQPAWVEAIYNRPVHATGTASKAHRTGNTLVRMAALNLVEGPFDEAYGLSGGSDSLLFRTLELKGKKLINSGEAIVSENVPEARSSWGWLRARARRQGQNYGRQTVSLHGGRFTRPVGWMGAKALVQVVVNGGGAIATWRDRPRRTTLLLKMWSNFGKLEGAMGTVSMRDA